MVRVGQDSEERFGSSENRLAVVEGRVNLVRRDLIRSEQRVNVVVARAAEEADGILNERFVFRFSLVRKIMFIILFLFSLG